MQMIFVISRRLSTDVFVNPGSVFEKPTKIQSFARHSVRRYRGGEGDVEIRNYYAKSFSRTTLKYSPFCCWFRGNVFRRLYRPRLPNGKSRNQNLWTKAKGKSLIKYRTNTRYAKRSGQVPNNTDNDNVHIYRSYLAAIDECFRVNITDLSTISHTLNRADRRVNSRFFRVGTDRQWGEFSLRVGPGTIQPVRYFLLFVSFNRKFTIS